MCFLCSFVSRPEDLFRPKTPEILSLHKAAKLGQLGLEQRHDGGVVAVLCEAQGRGAIGEGQTRVGAQRQQSAFCGLVAKLARHHKS